MPESTATPQPGHSPAAPSEPPRAPLPPQAQAALHRLHKALRPAVTA